MLYVDYFGPTDTYQLVSETAATEIAQVMRLSVGAVVIRRVVTETTREETELWIELSSDEQLYRLGEKIARGITTGLRRAGLMSDVWVMYRVVPLDRAFLNGEPRGRAAYE